MQSKHFQSTTFLLFRTLLFILFWSSLSFLYFSFHLILSWSVSIPIYSSIAINPSWAFAISTLYNRSSFDISISSITSLISGPVSPKWIVWSSSNKTPSTSTSSVKSPLRYTIMLLSFCLISYAYAFIYLLLWDHLKQRLSFLDKY